MVKKIAFGFLWLGFIIYAFFLEPPEQPGTFRVIENLSTGQWQGVNPLVISAVAKFSTMIAYRG